MRKISSKLVSAQEASKVSEELKQKGKKVVSTNGCFDILHWGHLQYLEKAREIGDVLICAVNSDRSVRKLKGPSRPINSEAVRASQLAALESVDYVVVFDEDTPEQILSLIKPHVHVKGGDYLPENLPERKIVEKFGGKVQCVELIPGFSTTSLINNLKS
ncbi:MAG: D-glycero-beta-D-manno-heptose 1-phosphate adenylyltransferase [Proteobacteria bacterium]|nr:D-glycero-beta-D-manno-heptose 1-phosphate adenylyltransferase [Pseudomonadota bacterium]NDC26043.1 D-glycero-beta-D-manno-heptose 1-phosphate adenylyltransferase [Pseudomonadota bacterium]NDD05868.1 D-glycero-beta-D-manno-heptose 1-phosphate adenylyltransferase [Pseudomonadota bacterium]NDG28293.1 D-glycero-beta-D-manno-heptose 1-phosphate adenylyltransferase [Pseudomonadota bacterium]